MFQPLSVEHCQIFKVLLALLHSAIVAGLVLGADEAKGAAATFGHRVYVASRIADRLLDMTAGGFGSLQGPCPALGIGEKTPELATMRAITGKTLARLQSLGASRGSATRARR